MYSRTDLLRTPLQAVDALFAQRISGACCGAPPVEWGEKSFFMETLGLKDEEQFAEIVCVNDVDVVASIPPFSLVRYRGLVQDIFEPEIYASLLRGRVQVAGQETQTKMMTTKYRECVEPAIGFELEDMGRDGLGQRGTCYCVPLPGESAWSRAAAAATGQQAMHHAPVAPVTAGAMQKRGRSEDDDVEMATEEPAKSRRPCTQGTLAATRTGGTGGGRSAAEMAADFGLNFPLPWEQQHGRGASTPCIVKLYDSDSESLRLCDTVEVLGVLCINPELTSFQASPLDRLGLGNARQPSSALVPRIHAIHVRHLPFYHPLLPFSPDWLSEARLISVYQRNLGTPGTVTAARDAALAQLTNHLGGDTLAAEYLLMLMVTQRFGLHGNQPLGSWALNITNWPDDLSTTCLSDAISELVPRSVCLKVSVDTLGSQQWRPRKDFDANRLVAAQLQLAPGTLLVLDETCLSEDNISGQGVKALGAIGTLVTEQQLTCDYLSYDVNVPLDIPCVIVSKQRSIIKDLEVVLPLRSCSVDTAPSMSTTKQPASLDAARLLLGLVTRRPRPLQIPDDAAHQLSADFAMVRQEFQVNANLCHAWLALARAQCLTFAEEALTPSRWHSLFECERQRLQRCREHTLACC